MNLVTKVIAICVVLSPTALYAGQFDSVFSTANFSRPVKTKTTITPIKTKAEVTQNTTVQPMVPTPTDFDSYEHAPVFSFKNPQDNANVFNPNTVEVKSHSYSVSKSQSLEKSPVILKDVRLMSSAIYR